MHLPRWPGLAYLYVTLEILFSPVAAQQYMNFRSIFSLMSSDLAIDLGTANTLVYAKSKGIVVNEPSIVAINKNNGEVEAVGKEAKEMLGRTPGNIVAIRPMKDGVIADFKVTERMLKYFIHKAHGRKMLVHPRIVIGVPSEITQVEKRAVSESAYRPERSEVHLVEAGDGRSNRRGTADYRTLRKHDRRHRRRYDRRRRHLLVRHRLFALRARRRQRDGRRHHELSEAQVQPSDRRAHGRADQDSVGSAFPLDRPITMEIKGRNLIEGVPKTVTVEDSEIREALSECVATIMNAIRVALERTPPELSADISDKGIVLTGGGAMMKNLDRRIREETGLPVSIAEDPLASVVLGTGKMLTDFKLLRRIAIE